MAKLCDTIGDKITTTDCKGFGFCARFFGKTDDLPNMGTPQTPSGVRKKAQPRPAKKPASKPNQKKAGRPSTYREDLAQTICERIAAGESLRKICDDDGMPCHVTVIRWLAKLPEFATRHARAREQQAQTFVDKMLDIAESEPERHPITGALDPASVTHIRNRVATMQWLAAKLNPKKYGDKVDLNHGGQTDNPLSVLLKQVSGTSLPVVPDDDRDD